MVVVHAEQKNVVVKLRGLDGLELASSLSLYHGLLGSSLSGSPPQRIHVGDDNLLSGMHV